MRTHVARAKDGRFGVSLCRYLSFEPSPGDADRCGRIFRNSESCARTAAMNLKTNDSLPAAELIAPPDTEVRPPLFRRAIDASEPVREGDDRPGVRESDGSKANNVSEPVRGGAGRPGVRESDRSRANNVSESVREGAVRPGACERHGSRPGNPSESVRDRTPRALPRRAGQAPRRRRGPRELSAAARAGARWTTATGLMQDSLMGEPRFITARSSLNRI